MATPVMTQPPKRKRVPYHFPYKITKAAPSAYKVKDGDSWKSIAEANQMDPKALVWFNYGTTNAPYVNWYLYHYAGCRTVSKDGRSWSFSGKDVPGLIVVPWASRGSVLKKPVQNGKASDDAWLYDHPSTCPLERLTCLTPEQAKYYIDKDRNKEYVGDHGRIVDYTVKRSQVYKTVEGYRVVYSAGPSRVIFLMDGHFYLQSSYQFVEDIHIATYDVALKSAMGMVYLGEIEMAFIMAFASAVSTVGLVAVTVVKAGQFVVDVDVRGLVRKVLALYSAYKALETIAPALLDKLFSWSSAWKLFKEVFSKLPGAFTELSAEDIAEIIGGVWGKLGKKAVVTLFSTVFTIATVVLKKLIPLAAGLAVKDRVDLAKELIKVMKAVGVAVTERDAATIVDEIVKNRDTIKRVLEELQTALQ